MPSIHEYLQLLLIRVAFLRFLLLLHPTLSSLGSSEAIDKTLIQVMSNFSRNIDQSQNLLRVVYDALKEQQLLGHEHAPGLIRLTA